MKQELKINGFWLGIALIFFMNAFVFNIAWLQSPENYRFATLEILSSIITIVSFGLAFRNSGGEK